MMTVRYPNGQAIQYNDANYLQHGDNSTWILKTKQDGDPIVFIQASAAAIVEFRHPCRVYDGTKKTESETIVQLAKEVRSMKRKLTKK
jgi:ActR/RegA family two-component response regulator